MSQIVSNFNRTQCMVKGFKKRNLTQSLSRDSRTIVQWTAFRRINWNKMLENQLLVSSYPVHSGLVRKAELCSTLKEDGRLGDSLLESYSCDTAR